jgi:Putative MetA-pathway of phenol degradation
MNRKHPRAFGVPRVMVLGAGLALMSGPTGWAADAKLVAPEPLLRRSQSWSQAGLAEQPPLSHPATQQHTAPPERATAGSDARSHRTRREEVDLTPRAAPQVKVRFGQHGEFERVVFEWPEAIDYEVVQHEDQVSVAFSRPGRIDLSRITDHLGPLVLDAWGDHGDVTGRIELRVLPNVRIRSFSLEGGRIVAIDMFGGTAATAIAPSMPNPEQDAIQELRQALEQRDATIQSLLARVEQLERVAGLSGGDLDRVTAGRAMATAPVGDLPPLRPASPPVVAIEAPSSEPSGKPPTGPSTPGTPEHQAATTSRGEGPESMEAPERQVTAQQQAPAPGQVEVDEEAAERALDFTLVQEGALLLPLGQAEFTPSFTYTRRTGDFPVVLDGLLAEEDVRRNEFEFLASFFVGLPFDSQLELSLPYNLVEQKIVDNVLGSPVQESSDTGHGLGDFSVGLAKTVLRERNWWPDVVLGVNWDTGTGESDDNNVPLEGGFQELTGSISLAKRQDPLVFVGQAFYQAAFEHNDVEPGDTLGFNIGTFLAASPRTALRVVLNQSFIDQFKVDGESINGSDQVQSILTFGASVTLGSNVLLDAAVDVGLTDDSPDYSVGVSLPIRFSTPGL